MTCMRLITTYIHHLIHLTPSHRRRRKEKFLIGPPPSNDCAEQALGIPGFLNYPHTRRHIGYSTDLV